jgi:hypothetical protein
MAGGGLAGLLTGFFWGLGSGVGFMIWVLIRLLNFQKKEVRARQLAGKMRPPADRPALHTRPRALDATPRAPRRRSGATRGCAG